MELVAGSANDATGITALLARNGNRKVAVQYSCPGVALLKFNVNKCLFMVLGVKS